MGVLKVLEVYGLTAVVFFGIDMVWLGLVAKDFYQRHLGHLMLDTPNWAVAVGFYLLYIAGIVVLVVLPAHEAGSAVRAALYGALFGLVAYATYDLTNLATLKDWSVTVTMVDLAWGTAVTGTVSFIGYHIARWVS